MILPILIKPHPILRIKAKEVALSDIKTAEMRRLFADMKETMQKANGVGLAANQVGISLRVIVVQNDKEATALINPKIVKKSLRKMESEEGCLSVPEIFGVVKRFKNVTVKALNADGGQLTIKADGLLAVILQHEIDHLDGILFVDKTLRFIPS